MQLVSWLTGGETQVVDLTQLEQLSEDPQTKARVQEAFARAAEKLGIGVDRKQEVVDMIDKLARELSYIERCATGTPGCSISARSSPFCRSSTSASPACGTRSSACRC